MSDTETVKYTRFCPCYDADGMNTASIKELPALSTSNISYTGSVVASVPTGPPSNSTSDRSFLSSASIQTSAVAELLIALFAVVVAI